MNSTLSPLGAARAYQSARKLEVKPTESLIQPQAVDRPSFAQLIEATARENIQTIRQGEAAAVAGLQGQMPMQKVVEATLAMESALKTTVALRDRAVEAYQEIMRMSI